MKFLTENQINEFSTQGFTVVPNFLKPTEVTVLRLKLSKLVEIQRESATPYSEIDDYMVHNPMVLDSDFLYLLEHPKLISILDELLGRTSILYAYTTSSMPAGGSNYSNRIHVDSPRIVPDYLLQLAMIIPLDDFTAENGATYFLPNSFDLATQPTEEEFMKNAVQALPLKGDIIIFNPRTWHLGGVNRTDQDRHAITLSACRSFMRQRFDYPRLINKELADSLSPTLRRILGFNVRVPTSLAEYYVPENERLYKANQG